MVVLPTSIDENRAMYSLSTRLLGSPEPNKRPEEHLAYVEFDEINDEERVLGGMVAPLTTCRFITTHHHLSTARFSHCRLIDDFVDADSLHGRLLAHEFKFLPALFEARTDHKQFDVRAQRPPLQMQRRESVTSAVRFWGRTAVPPEAPALAHHRPARNIEAAFYPTPRGRDNLFWEDRDSRGRVDVIRRGEVKRVSSSFLIHAERGPDRLRHPVKGHIGQ